jgi:hypothetical protein
MREKALEIEIKQKNMRLQGLFVKPIGDLPVN